jgi:hypothetical protein
MRKMRLRFFPHKDTIMMWGLSLYGNNRRAFWVLGVSSCRNAKVGTFFNEPRTQRATSIVFNEPSQNPAIICRVCNCNLRMLRVERKVLESYIFLLVREAFRWSSFWRVFKRIVGRSRLSSQSKIRQGQEIKNKRERMSTTRRTDCEHTS